MFIATFLGRPSFYVI